MTTWSGRSPLSSTNTTYNESVSYNAALRFDGVTINNTSWSSTRTSITRFASYLCDRLWNQICDVSGNPIIVYDPNGSINPWGTNWTGRIIP